MDIHYLFQVIIYIYRSSSDALDTNQEVKKPLTGKIQFLPGQAEILCRLAPEAPSPNSCQLQRICLSNGWAETLQELGDFVPNFFIVRTFTHAYLIDSHERNGHCFILVFFSIPNSLDLAKTHFKKVCFKVPIISFFWDLPIFPCHVVDSIAN